MLMWRPHLAKQNKILGNNKSKIFMCIELQKNWTLQPSAVACDQVFIRLSTSGTNQMAQWVYRHMGFGSTRHCRANTHVRHNRSRIHTLFLFDKRLQNDKIMCQIVHDYLYEKYYTFIICEIIFRVVSNRYVYICTTFDDLSKKNIFTVR